MDTAFCPICGKEYKDVNMHIRKGHGREPEEVIEEAFGQKLSPRERQKGTAQTRRINETMDRVNERSKALQKTHGDRMREMQDIWRRRREEFNKVMNERITNITNK